MDVGRYPRVGGVGGVMGEDEIFSWIRFGGLQAPRGYINERANSAGRQQIVGKSQTFFFVLTRKNPSKDLSKHANSFQAKKAKY